MKILKLFLAIFLLALVAATAVTEEEKSPSFLQTSETNALTNELAVASADEEDSEDDENEDGKLIFIKYNLFLFTIL